MILRLACVSENWYVRSSVKSAEVILRQKMPEGRAMDDDMPEVYKTPMVSMP
ncbi:MAG TPA: hypothetical protein H9756_03005 [Candidatus Mediterraneibacter gallistercoris]|uniref:Uncharacterized protein n=1 Tax=Candidatus Mediterraneibacter gallistercoris TaxID=2838671 RepID=A0A9D2P1Z6_9FIRM|nr:hypothetical protein [Candidatus Mediterraneibacter gallistercoris]